MKKERKIMGIAKMLARNVLSWTSWGRAYYKRRKQQQKDAEIANVQKNGKEVLLKVNELLCKENIEYTVAFGTLLGCIREGEIIKHDDDIDFAIMPNAVNAGRLVRLLENAGFEFFWAWKCQGRITEIAVTYRDVHIDFYFLHEVDGYYEAHWYMPLDGVKYPDDKTWSTLCIRLLKTEGVMPWHLSMYDIDVMVPRNYDEILTSHYGSWRKPDPNWKVDLQNKGIALQSNDRKHFIEEFGRQISKDEVFENRI